MIVHFGTAGLVIELLCCETTHALLQLLGCSGALQLVYLSLPTEVFAGQRIVSYGTLYFQDENRLNSNYYLRLCIPLKWNGYSEQTLHVGS